MLLYNKDGKVEDTTITPMNTEIPLSVQEIATRHGFDVKRGKGGYLLTKTYPKTIEDYDIDTDRVITRETTVFEGYAVFVGADGKMCGVGKSDILYDYDENEKHINSYHPVRTYDTGLLLDLYNVLDYCRFDVYAKNQYLLIEDISKGTNIYNAYQKFKTITKPYGVSKAFYKGNTITFEYNEQKHNTSIMYDGTVYIDGWKIGRLKGIANEGSYEAIFSKAVLDFATHYYDYDSYGYDTDFLLHVTENKPLEAYKDIDLCKELEEVENEEVEYE